MIPVSFFEKAGPAYYNSVAMIDADGALLGVYRKSHIPDGPGYEEKFYFRPGDTGFRPGDAKPATHRRRDLLGPVVPRGARAMVAAGRRRPALPDRDRLRAREPALDTRDRWQRAMIGHAVSNVIPVVAANRDRQRGRAGLLRLAPSSRTTRGEKLAELGRDEEGVAVATVDLARVRRERASWGFFRDRRPELYQPLTS